tara:strand:+ start:4713 stop:4946 length:234 start_codon:yes stop_codon:yes gene_type:complete
MPRSRNHKVWLPKNTFQQSIAQTKIDISYYLIEFDCHLLDVAANSEHHVSKAYLKQKEWNSYVSHFSLWERENTFDI